jgi:dTDP-glucose pyrophosphorylase
VLIVIPMAGSSNRFKAEGYKVPKYMLPLGSESLFYESVKSFERYFSNSQFLFITTKEHGSREFIARELDNLGIKNPTIIVLEEQTAGQADTVFQGLQAASISDAESVLIFNIDTIRKDYVFPAFDSKPDGYLEVFEGEGEHWSFVLPGSDSRVIETAEKNRISNLCSSGLYYFATVVSFKSVFLQEIERHKESVGTTNEIYIAPMYNLLIQDGADVRYRVVDKECLVFCGTPLEYSEALEELGGG